MESEGSDPDREAMESAFPQVIAPLGTEQMPNDEAKTTRRGSFLPKDRRRHVGVLISIAMSGVTCGSVDRAPSASSDPAAWTMSRDEDGTILELTGDAAYEPPFRSPRAIALFPEVYADFELELEAQQTGPEYGHRDLCFFFAFESPSRFGYVHLASVPDANAHNVFIVDGAPRRNLLPPQTSGVKWGSDEWHRVRLIRRGARLDVFFDDAASPILSAYVPLGAGRVGVGSFDDRGRFRAIRIEGDVLRRVESNPFESGR